MTDQPKCIGALHSVSRLLYVARVPWFTLGDKPSTKRGLCNSLEAPGCMPGLPCNRPSETSKIS